MRRIYGTHTCFTVSRFSLQTGEPQINISSTPPSNKLSINAAINLTCTAWQSNELAKNPWTRPYIIEWFDPQDKRIGSQCRAEWPTAIMKCPLKVGALTNGTVGNYTCRARNVYNYCSTKKIQIGLQGKLEKPEWSVAQVILWSTSVRPLSYGWTVVPWLRSREFTDYAKTKIYTEWWAAGLQFR